MGSYIKATLLLILLVVLVTFGIKNNETMILHFYFQWSSMPIPVYAVVYGSLIVGVLIGEIIGIGARFSQRKKLKELQKENRDLKAKVAEAPEEKSVEESVVEEKETPQEETAEVKYEPEAKKEEEAEEEEGEEEEEEEKKEENETRF
jgi:uncharacterized integral membrane protein